MSNAVAIGAVRRLYKNAEPDREAHHPPDQEQIDRTEQPGRERVLVEKGQNTPRLVGLDSDSRA